MSHRDDYSDEMFTKRLSDDDVEAVLSGHAPNDTELAEIARALRALEPKHFEDTTGEKAAAFARQAAALARAGEPVKLAATARYRRGLSLTPRLAPAAVAAILLFAMTGVAVASDSSIPGDAFYTIDRAVEHIGIGNGGAAERLEEASILTENGDSAEALELLAESFDEESSEVADALHHASERVREGHGGDSAVADMLAWMAETDMTGQEFGQRVAERAGQLGQAPEPEDRGKSSQAPGQDDQTPGQSDEAPGQGGEDPGPGSQGQEDQGQEDQGQGNEGGQGEGNQGQGESNDAPGQTKP